MCFSMPASLAAGTTLVVAGGATVRMTTRAVERPLALLPLLFGVQQLTEGAVWWSLLDHHPRLDLGATVGYTLFARVLWPVLVPFAVRSLEPVPWRRRALAGAVAVGALVALEGLWALLHGATTSQVCGSSVQYARPSLAVVAVYLVATCGGAMVSSHRFLRWMGFIALALALLTLWLYAAVFVSVWCFFCAVLTVMIFGFVRHLRRPPRAAAG